MEWDGMRPLWAAEVFLAAWGPAGPAGKCRLCHLIVTAPGRNCGWSRERWDRCERCRHEKAEMMPGCFESGSFVNFVFFRCISGPRDSRDLTASLQLINMAWTQTLLWDSLFALRLWDWHGRTGVLRVASSSPILLPFHRSYIVNRHNDII